MVIKHTNLNFAKLSIIAILMMYSFEANANAVKISETLSVDTGQGAKIHKFVPKNSKTYSSDLIKTVDLTHIPTGAKARINAKITASVSRAGVLSGVGKLVRQGAKFGTRAVPYVETALLAHDVYETFKEDIQARGCRYDPETDKFVKGYEYANCLWYEDERRINKTYGCYGVDSSIMRLMPDRSRFPEVKQLMESQMYRLARPFWNWRKEQLNKLSSLDWNNFVLNRCTFDWNGGGCPVNKGDDFR
ncbi:TPA: IgG-binding virulence factor TspB family protein, partial [Neisseria gonorrhoeae]